MGPSLFWHVICVHFGWKLHGRNLNCQCAYYVGNVGVRLLKDYTKGPIRRTQALSRHFLDSVNWQAKATPHRLTDSPSMGRRRWELILWRACPYECLSPDRPRAHNSPLMDQRSVVHPVNAGLCITACAFLLKGWMGNSPHVLNLP